MKNYIFIGFLFLCFSISAQTKKPVPGKKPAKPEVAVKDSVVEPVEEVEPFPTEFTVYTKRSKTKKQRMKLCINLVHGDSILNYCMNDSLLRDPEVKKILFQKEVSDTTYVLVYAQTFTKDPELPECSAGREAKLFFIRWNTVQNKAIVKQKYIESCYKTITRMGKEPVIENWDGQTPLKISYHRGTHFHDITFDPQNYLLGIQSSGDLDAR
jgi:hypothetical protein